QATTNQNVKKRPACSELRWAYCNHKATYFASYLTGGDCVPDDYFIGIRVNRAKKSGMVNITSSVNSRERSGINTILHELNPLFTINVTMRDIKSKNVYSRVNSKATTQWRKTESANGVHLE